MSSFNESGKLSGVANVAIAKYLRLIWTAAGRVGIAGVADHDIGTAENIALAAEDDVMIRARNSPGSRKVVMATDVAVGADLFTAAGGKLSKTQAAGAFLWGNAVSSASADGDVIEALPASMTGAAGS